MVRVLSKFNPVRYIRRRPDGSTELPLFARLLWLSSERPGWRVTSEKISVIGLDVPDAEGHVSTRYVAVGHVAVIDEQGRKVVSVPSSVEIDSPDFADVLFRDAASLALDNLGFHIQNIPEEYWQEMDNIPSVREAVPKPQKQASTPKQPERREEPAVQEEVFEEPPKDRDLEETLKLFTEALEKNPLAVGISPREKEEDPMALFNKYCYRICGIPWSMASDDEKKKVRECLEALS